MNERTWHLPRSWLAVILVSLAVVMGVVTTVVLARPGGGNQAVAAAHPTSTATTPTSGATESTATAAFHYLPLWPFASAAEAAAWQDSYRSGGHQPWHLDAGQTALSFTQGWLGYTNVDEVTKTVLDGGESWVSVGFANPNGQPVTSAVLHLVKIGTGTDAPWEVVGTEDTTLTLTTPGYGTTVRSPVTVGGRITGVDENLRVRVRQLGQSAPIGEAGGVPAGGDRSQWKVGVPFAAAGGSTLTIAVATGGHIAAVERFAITGVRS